MMDETAIYAVRGGVDLREVGDNGLMVALPDGSSYNARGIPRAILGRIDGQTAMGALIDEAAADLAFTRDEVEAEAGPLIDSFLQKGIIEPVGPDEAHG